MLANIRMGDEISVVTLTHKKINTYNESWQVISFLSILYIIKGSDNVRSGCDQSEQWNRVDFF